MFDLQHKCSNTFNELGLNLMFLDYYDSKGNIGVLGDGVPGEDIKNALFRAVGKTCAIVRPVEVTKINRIFEACDVPPSVPGFRWTRGVSLICDGEERNEDNEKMVEPEIGYFLKIEPGMFVVYRKERETERGTLDSDSRARKGGWTAVSRFTERFNGGLWTARSLGTLCGLHDRVERMVIGSPSKKGK